MMKKICLLVLIMVLGKISYGQYPLTQNLGSDSTIVISKGATQSRFVNIIYTDTTAANLQRIRQYPGAQIVTTNGGSTIMWIRNQNATRWLQVPTGSATGNIYTLDGTLTGNRTLSGGASSLTFQGLDKFVVSADSLRFIAGNQALIIAGDTASLSQRLSYTSNLGNTFTQYSLVDKNYVDSAITSSPAGTVTSVGLTMPSAFNVSGSPVTSAGTLSVTGAGVASQYIRGDGQLATLPTTGGGGSSVSYYLNGSVNQGTFVGNTYYQMNKTPVIGTGTDFTISSNGYIASFITNAGDPGLLNIPAGNWDFEVFFESSSNTGTPSFYVELYKYDGTTFTLIASSSTNPKFITGGTNVDAYYTPLAVPATTLTITDRLAVRIYVNNSGNTITLHTEDNNLCQIITTFSTGINALNGLTSQVQYFATGTSGTDFNISSLTDTHTFNLPTASATNRGALSSADWTTFNSKVGGSGTSGQVAYFTGTNSVGGNSAFTFSPTAQLLLNNSVTASSAIARGANLTPSLTAAANNDVLVGLDVNPTFTNGAFTGVQNLAARFQDNVLISKNQNTAIVANISNTTAGTDAATVYRLSPNTGIADFGKYSSSTTAYKFISSGDAYLYNSVNGDLSILNDFGTGAIKFGAGGTSTAQMRIFSNGNVGINQNTDAGFRLDVNGTARVSGTELRLDNGTTGVINLYSNTPEIRFFSGDATGYRIFRSGTVMTWNSAGNINLQINSNNAYTLSSSNGHIWQSANSGGAALARLDAGGSLSIGNGSNAANASSILDLTSTTKGFLQPRMTTAQRDAITSPATGLSIYNTTTNTPDYYNGSAWVGGTSGSGTAGQVTYWSGTSTQTGSNNLFWDNANARLGIGTNAPTNKLHVSYTGLGGIALQSTGTFSYLYNNATNFIVASTSGTTGYKFYVHLQSPDNSMYIQQNGYVYIDRRLGIGTASPNNLLHLYNASSVSLSLQTTGGYAYFSNDGTNAYLSSDKGTTGQKIYFALNAPDNALNIKSNGNTIIGSATDAGYRLDVNGTARVGNRFYVGSTNSNWWANYTNVLQNGQLALLDYGSGANSPSAGIVNNSVFDGTASKYIRTGTASSISFTNGGDIEFSTWASGTAGNNLTGQFTPLVVKNGSNSILIGTTFSGTLWNGSRNIFIGAAGYVYGSTGVDAVFGVNSYYDGTNSKRIVAGYVSDLYFDANGDANFRSATTSTANSNITFATNLTIKNSGSVGIGTTSPGSRLQVNGGAAIGYSASTTAPTNGLQVAGATTLNDLLTVTPPANTGAIKVESFSLTGSDQTPMVSLAGTWNTTGNPTAIRLNVTNTASGATADLMELQVGGTSQFTVTKAGNTEMTGSVKTGAPSGGTAQAWKLGSVVASSVTYDPNNYVEVEINGSAYKLALAIPSEPEPLSSPDGYVPNYGPIPTKVTSPTTAEKLSEMQKEIAELREIIKLLKSKIK